MSALADLKEKIHSLETERARLANEVEIMRKAAENRVTILERDISQLRAESKALRELLLSSERIGVAGSASKPAAAAPVEASARIVPEIPVQSLSPEKAESPAFMSEPPVAHTVDAIPQPSVSEVPQTSPREIPKNGAEASSHELEPKKSEAESEVPSQEDPFKMLSIEEQKVIDILHDHGGRYTRANVRAEAGLGWLQTNRVISHLAERGIISLEKSGASMELVLKEEPQ